MMTIDEQIGELTILFSTQFAGRVDFHHFRWPIALKSARRRGAGQRAKRSAFTRSPVPLR